MIKIENLTVAFDGKEAVKNINLELKEGEILGVVGESGSGKSVTALTLMGLDKEDARLISGKITFRGEVLLEAGKSRDKALYRKYQGDRMSMIFQEPMTSLNPTQKVGKQVEEVLRLHTSLGKEQIKEKVLETFVSVGLREVETVYESYPHQLSGGMRQRVMIAMAIILHPDLIVADEPTTALDVTIQNQIIELLRKINKAQNNTMLFITHDLNLAKRICNRIAVMKDGEIVELGETKAVFENPKEDYTRRLIEAVPSRVRKKAVIKADPVNVNENCSSVPEDKTKVIVDVKDLNVYYKEGSNSLFGSGKMRCVVEGATFQIYQGETLGLVGESGCGKTSLCKAILGMNKNITGEVESRIYRPQMIFQDPYSSLNPSKTIGWLLQEPLRAMGQLDASRAMTSADMEVAAHDMLHKVGLQDEYFDRKPFQLSGGQRQRISIGQALITRPALVMADEPVSALDVTMQAQIMELMQKLQEEMKLSYLFISHDINVIYQMSDRIMVMKDGKILELGETEEVFNHPKEEYTKQLLKES